MGERWEDVDVRTLVAWLLDRQAEGDHACMTGDCVHLPGEDCVAALIDCFWKDQPIDDDDD